MKGKYNPIDGALLLIRFYFFTTIQILVGNGPNPNEKRLCDSDRSLTLPTSLQD